MMIYMGLLCQHLINQGELQDGLLPQRHAALEGIARGRRLFYRESARLGALPPQTALPLG